MCNSTIISKLAVFFFIILAASGCERDTTGLEPVPGIPDPVVFDDDFSSYLDYRAFEGSDLNALSIDTEIRHSGTASLKVNVPDPGSYAGGTFCTPRLRDLTSYDALGFWARASRSQLVNEIGFGIDASWETKYQVTAFNIPLDTQWKKYYIPIPNPERLSYEGGLFFYSDNADDDTEGYEIWFDDVIFEKVEPGTITNPRPEMESSELGAFIGATVDMPGATVTYSINGEDLTISCKPGYLTFFSSNEEVVQVSGESVNVVGEGTAEISATLYGTPVDGTVQIEAGPAPLVPAPVPQQSGANVISLFSNVYDDIQVDSWSADWPDMADVADFKIGEDDLKVYTNLIYAGITFENDLIDAADMDYFHIDVWLPEGVTLFKVKLVDFGEDGTWQGAPDSQCELTFDAGSTPALVTGDWFSLDIPIEDFMYGTEGLFAREHLAQMLLSGTGNTAFVDNIYFYMNP
ncbi:MAG: hypothetical protein JW746_03730 [Candidatus Krumholzibacteriota bacterium]|nr:hypothetical protein [Candidatus Krumholzibacteriota bacterium]